MGKVKFLPSIEKDIFEKYQFPMGKVKGIYLDDVLNSTEKVSIPYGKGKEKAGQAHCRCRHCINSLWER